MKPTLEQLKQSACDRARRSYLKRRTAILAERKRKYYADPYKFMQRVKANYYKRKEKLANQHRTKLVQS